MGMSVTATEDATPSRNLGWLSCGILKAMTPEEFLNRCKTICHVGPAGVWEQISRYGFRTAEQLILEADLTDEERHRLLSEPRREAIRLHVRGQEVTLRDQGPLFARKDLQSVKDIALDFSDWIHLLNQRVYFFTDQTSMQKLLDKYVQVDGAQDVIWLSPLKLLETEGVRLSSRAESLARLPAGADPRSRRRPLYRFSGFQTEDQPK